MTVPGIGVICKNALFFPNSHHNSIKYSFTMTGYHLNDYFNFVYVETHDVFTWFSQK